MATEAKAANGASIAALKRASGSRTFKRGCMARMTADRMYTATSGRQPLRSHLRHRPAVVTSHREDERSISSFVLKWQYFKQYHNYAGFRYVLDTDVVVAALRSSRGSSRQLLLGA